MNFDCSLALNGATCFPNAGLSKFKFTSGKTYRLRLINAGAEGLQKFTIDNHTLTIIANDFVPIRPYDTNVVTLGVGQRSDILVKAIGNLTEPLFRQSPPKEPAFTQDIDISFGTNATGAMVWMMNNQSFRANYESVKVSFEVMSPQS
jgi:FtsP/CotA-like multicopper oxidase with cupredoxin domain